MIFLVEIMVSSRFPGKVRYEIANYCLYDYKSTFVPPDKDVDDVAWFVVFLFFNLKKNIVQSIKILIKQSELYVGTLQ